jgi:uncharacterized protein (TIGR02118 family)
MTYEIVVCYGKPADPAAFDQHYRATHIPLTNKLPGLSDFTYGKCRSLDGAEPAYYSVARLQFDTEEDLRQASTSPEMRAAARDVRDFATGGVTMFVQVVESARQ